MVVLVCSSGAGIPDPVFSLVSLFLTLEGKLTGHEPFDSWPSVTGHTNGGTSDGEEKEKDEECKIKKEGECALFPAGTGKDSKACKMNQETVKLNVILGKRL